MTDAVSQTTEDKLRAQLREGHRLTDEEWSRWRRALVPINSHRSFRFLIVLAQTWWIDDDPRRSHIYRKAGRWHQDLHPDG